MLRRSRSVQLYAANADPSYFAAGYFNYLATLCRQMDAQAIGQFITLHFIYVTDVVRAFYMAACSGHEGEIYNVGANNPQSVFRLVELLEGEVIFVPKRPGEPDCTWAETAKINRNFRTENEHFSFRNNQLMHFFS